MKMRASKIEVCGTPKEKKIKGNNKGPSKDMLWE